MIIVSVSHTPTLVVGVRHYVCIQCPDVYRVPLTHSFTKQKRLPDTTLHYYVEGDRKPNFIVQRIYWYSLGEAVGR